eukprot:305099-Rhodomonas_salina.3
MVPVLRAEAFIRTDLLPTPCPVPAWQYRTSHGERLAARSKGVGRYRGHFPVGLLLQRADWQTKHVTLRQSRTSRIAGVGR